MKQDKSDLQQMVANAMKGFEYNELGISAYNEGKFQKAVDYLTKSIEYAETPFNYSCRASAFFHLGEYRKAIKDYNNEVILKSLSKMDKKTLVEMYKRLAFAHEELEELQSAVDYHTKVIELDIDGFDGNDAATRRAFLKAIIVRNSRKQDFRIIKASRNIMESTGQEVLILELSEVDYTNIHSGAYTFEIIGKEFIFDFVSFYELSKSTFFNEEIFTINLSEFQPLVRDSKLIHFHKSVKLISSI